MSVTFSQWASEKVPREFSEGQKEGKRAPLNMLTRAHEGDREQTEKETRAGCVTRLIEKRRFQEHGIFYVKCHPKKTKTKNKRNKPNVARKEDLGMANYRSMVTK